MAEAEILSPALGALLDIMTSNELPEARCIEAARAIIEYEAPADVFDLTYEYLLGIARDAGQEVGLKLEALKLIRKVEAKRVVPGTAKAVDTAKSLALGKQVARAKRRMELVQAGKWPSEPGWDDDLAEVRGVLVEGEGIADRLEAARTRRTGGRPIKLQN